MSKSIYNHDPKRLYIRTAKQFDVLLPYHDDWVRVTDVQPFWALEHSQVYQSDGWVDHCKGIPFTQDKVESMLARFRDGGVLTKRLRSGRKY